ncbi:MAG TPA: hypothetical protein VGF77_00955 [Allosphingosinicella sp.]|jgi:hypothetical protein
MILTALLFATGLLSAWTSREAFGAERPVLGRIMMAAAFFFVAVSAFLLWALFRIAAAGLPA